MGTRLRKSYSREVLELYAEQTADPAAQENFDRIRRVLERSLLLLFDGDHYEYTFDRDSANIRLPHGLGYIPKDAWLTSTVGTGSFTFNYGLFDSESFDFTVSGTSASDPLVVRFFAGQFVG